MTPLPAGLSGRLLEVAASMLGTPWHHQGRAPGVGLDCVGLLVATARGCGVEAISAEDYAEDADPAELERYLRLNCWQIEEHEAGAADLVRLWIVRPEMAIHAGILDGQGNIIHARRRRVPQYSQVVREPFARWREHAVDFWRYRLWQLSSSP